MVISCWLIFQMAGWSFVWGLCFFAVATVASAMFNKYIKSKVVSFKISYEDIN
jgi:hypothetical protein